jgi:hypothetical protein
MTKSNSPLQDMSIAERLAAINGLLKAQGLRPLPSLGDTTAGFSEIVDIVEWLPPQSAQWRDVVFLVRRVNGSTYKHQVRFNVNGSVCDGVVFVPVINGSVALVQQFRKSVGMETWELPRGFAENAADILTGKDGKVPAALFRELDEEVLHGASVKRVESLGAIADNTGTHNVWLEAYVVDIECEQEIVQVHLGGTNKFGVKLVSWEDLKRPSALGLRDAHSLAAISLVRERRGV